MGVLIPVYSTQLSISSTPTKLLGAPVNALTITGGPLAIIAVKEPGTQGNLWTLRIQTPVATDQTLTHKLDQTNRALTILLGTDHSGNVITTGQNLMDYVTTGAGTELCRFFSFRLAGTNSVKLSDNTTPAVFGTGADPLKLWTYQQPTHMVMSVSGATLRYRVDGQYPTASVGNRILTNTDLTWMDPKADYSNLLANLTLIAETGTAVVDYTLYHNFGG